VCERNEVLAAVSHDLKNPLAVIMGQAQLLENHASQAPGAAAGQLKAGLTRIQANARKMARLLNEMLDAVQAEAGDMLVLERQPIDLVSLARGATDEFVTASNKHTITVESATTALIGDWDAFRLERVLGNLLSNAVKYSPDGGAIRVRIDQDDAGWALLEVHDEGQGIPAAALPYVFNRFYRAANAQLTAGTGIGLAVVRRIVEQHGGSVRVQSEVGAGTTVTVRLPLHGAGRAVSRPPVDMPAIVEARQAIQAAG
jgi:signal transduction histidine kinase